MNVKIFSIANYCSLILIAICIAIDVWTIHWLVDEEERISANNSFREYISLFRQNSFVGMTEDDLVAKFGEPIDVEMQDDEKRRGAIWWPSWDADAGRDKLIKRIDKEKFVKMCMFEEDGKNVYVWLVENSNGVWNVIYDNTPRYADF